MSLNVLYLEVLFHINFYSNNFEYMCKKYNLQFAANPCKICYILQYLFDQYTSSIFHQTS